MKLKPLIDKILRSETLDSAEADILADFDPDALTNELSDARSKIAELESAHNELCRRQQIEKISAEIGCTDPDYLDYRACRAGLDLNDTEAVKNFADEISRNSPGCFRARIVPGSSAGTVHTAEQKNHTVSENTNFDRIGYITEQLRDVPEIRY